MKKSLTSQKTIYKRIREIIESSRNNIARAVNSEMVKAYWLIGKEIVEEEQRGQHRAKYGEMLLESLSIQLTRDYGDGFKSSNLWGIRKFYQTYPILDALRTELSRTHYRLLMRIERPEARKFYEVG